MKVTSNIPALFATTQPTKPNSANQNIDFASLVSEGLSLGESLTLEEPMEIKGLQDSELQTGSFMYFNEAHYADYTDEQKGEIKQLIEQFNQLNNEQTLSSELPKKQELLLQQLNQQLDQFSGLTTEVDTLEYIKYNPSESYVDFYQRTYNMTLPMATGYAEASEKLKELHQLSTERELSKEENAMVLDLRKRMDQIMLDNLQQKRISLDRLGEINGPAIMPNER